MRGDAINDITLSPFYHSSVNEITQPDKFAVHSHYVTRRWKRELGPTGYAVLTSLRERCYYNRKTGELRNSIQVTMEEIADECGISERTVRRELDTNKALQKFVRAQREYEHDPRRGGFRYGAKSFQVSMDDPLHPFDEAALIEIVGRRAEEAEKANETPLDRARRKAASTPASSNLSVATSGQSDRTQPGRSDNLPQRPDNLTGRSDKLTALTGQNDRTLKTPDSSLLKHSSPDVSDFSLALFEEKTEEKKVEPAKASSLPVWPSLSEAEQHPWLDQARQELLLIHAGSGITPKPKLVEVRAKNLWEKYLSEMSLKKNPNWP